MNWVYTSIYLAVFAGVVSAMYIVVAINSFMWPFSFLLLPLGAWGALDVWGIWK